MPAGTHANSNFSTRRSQRGNLLLQAVLGLLVMTTGGVFISKMLLQSQKFERGIAADSDSREISSLIQLLTGSRAACGKTTLIGLNLRPLLGGNPTPVSVNLRLLAADGSLSGPDLGPGKLYGNRTIESLEFKQLIPIQGSDYFATMEMDAPVRGSAVSIKSSISTFLLRVTLDSNSVVTACSGSSDLGRGSGSGAGSLAALLGVPNPDDWPDLIACPNDGRYLILEQFRSGVVGYNLTNGSGATTCQFFLNGSPRPRGMNFCPPGCQVHFSTITSFMNFR